MQLYFAGGDGRRDYLIVHQASGWEVRSLAQVVKPKSLDLRKRGDAAKLEAAAPRRSKSRLTCTTNLAFGFAPVLSFRRVVGVVATTPTSFETPPALGLRFQLPAGRGRTHFSKELEPVARRRSSSASVSTTAPTSNNSLRSQILNLVPGDAPSIRRAIAWIGAFKRSVGRLGKHIEMCLTLEALPSKTQELLLFELRRSIDDHTDLQADAEEALACLSPLACSAPAPS